MTHQVNINDKKTELDIDGVYTFCFCVWNVYLLFTSYVDLDQTKNLNKRKRGSYHCGRCGQLKRGHQCSMDEGKGKIKFISSTTDNDDDDTSILLNKYDQLNRENLFLKTELDKLLKDLSYRQRLEVDSFYTPSMLTISDHLSKEPHNNYDTTVYMTNEISITSNYLPLSYEHKKTEQFVLEENYSHDYNHEHFHFPSNFFT